MRRSIAAAVVVFAMVVPSAADAYYAPPIENIGPPSGSAVLASVGSAVKVEFTCPRFNTEYIGVKDYEAYWVEFSLSTVTNSEGEFASPVRLERAKPTAASDERCEGSLASESVARGSTVYWRATRINCEVASCNEAGPTWSFSVAAPTPVAPTVPTSPSPSPAAPRGPSSGEGEVTVYLGCGTTRHTKAASICGKNQPIGAFFRDSKEAVYTVCVRYPGGTKPCVHSQRAEAGVLYVNTLKRHSAGRYAVTWTVGGRRFERHIVRAGT
ncbi:MAG: hypothetical protein JST53_01640 [Actinobacteria bacterium]|nr:hypothetical protein [Actinomycetota bacterium]